MKTKTRSSLLVLAGSLAALTLWPAIAAAQLAPPRIVGPGPVVKPAPTKAEKADDEADKVEDVAEKYLPGGAALKTDPEQQRLLKRAEQCVEDGRMDLAAVLWQRVLDEAGDTLMVSKVLEYPGSERKFIMYSSLAEHVERTLSKLPPLALATYRISADGEAQAILAAAPPDREEEALSQVVRRFFLSTHGDDAAYRLACLALDRHDFVGASRLLTRILENHPDPSIPKAELWLRLAVASSRMNDRQTAQQSLTALTSATGPRPPSEIIDLITQDVQTAAQATSVATAAAKDWHMLLGNPQRSGHMVSLPGAATSRTLSELWVQEYPLALTGQNNPNMGWGGMMPGVVVFSGRMRNQPNEPTPVSREEFISKWRENAWRPASQLLFDGGKVFIKAPDHLVAFSTTAHDNRPIWKSVWENQYELDGMSQMMAMMAMNYGMNMQMTAGGKPRSPAEVMLFGDRVHQAMSISDGVIYSIEGKKVSQTSSQPNPAMARGFQWGVTPRRTRSNWLTAYSTAGGKVRWSRTASDEDKEGTTEVGFLAAPVPCGSLLVAPVTDGGTIWLFGLDREDGHTVWKSYLCDEPQGGANPWAEIAIAVDGREAYLTCGCGVVFAVDAVGGVVRWAIRYQRDGKRNTMMAQMYGNQNAGLLDLDGWDDDVVIPYGKGLVVLPSDADRVFALDRRTGNLLWESPRTSPFGTVANYVLGVQGRGLFVAGKNAVRRYDLPSGRLVWEKEIGDSFGRGCVTADSVYLPVRDSILQLEAEKGREVSQVGAALTSEEPVGNLYSDGEKLWVVGAGRVYAMTTLEHRMKILADQIAAGDGDAQLNRMRLYVKQNKLDLAMDDLRGAYVLYQAQLTPDEAAGKFFAAISELKLPSKQPLLALQLLTEQFGGKSPKPELSKEALARRSDLVMMAVSVIRQQKLPGAVPIVLAAAPLMSEDYLVSTATFAVDASATKDDAALLIDALQGNDPAAQLLAVRATARVVPDDSKAPLKQLVGKGDDRVRLAAVRALANLGEKENVLETFASLLESENPRVRARSHQSLRALTSQTINFSPEGKAEDRAAAVKSWKDWIATNGATAKLTLPLTEKNVPLGRTLFVAQQHSKLIEFGPDNKPRWEVQLPGPAWGCQGLPNGHRLVAVYSQSVVIEYDDEGKEVWRKDRLPGPPYSVQRLENGNTLVACADAQQIVEIAPDGTQTATTIQGRPMSAQRLENGNTLVALQQQNKIVELDRANKVVWEARTNNPPGHAVRLENGNTLVSMTYTRQVLEYDATGKTVVWQSKVPMTNPYAAQRLANGNTLVADHQGLHELDAAGQKIIWTHRQPGITGVSAY
jgi:outer membrane protein assembly factor BamB